MKQWNVPEINELAISETACFGYSNGGYRPGNGGHHKPSGGYKPGNGGCNPGEGGYKPGTWPDCGDDDSNAGDLS